MAVTYYVSGPSDSGIQKLFRCHGVLHDAHPASHFQIVNLSEKRELGRGQRLMISQ